MSIYHTYLSLLNIRRIQTDPNNSLTCVFRLFKFFNSFLVSIHLQKSRSLADRRKRRRLTFIIAGEYTLRFHGSLQALQMHVEVPSTIHHVLRCIANLMLSHIEPCFFR